MIKIPQNVNLFSYEMTASRSNNLDWLLGGNYIIYRFSTVLNFVHNIMNM